MFWSTSLLMRYIAAHLRDLVTLGSRAHEQEINQFFPLGSCTSLLLSSRLVRVTSHLAAAEPHHPHWLPELYHLWVPLDPSAPPSARQTIKLLLTPCLSRHKEMDRFPGGSFVI